jgi:DHA2 family multidrug resistance protein-like MFS transporter
MSLSAAAPRHARASAQEWLGLAVLALPTLLLSLDITVLHLAVPHLDADLSPSTSELLWIVDIYGFMIAGFLITMGALGDRVGRRRLLVIGAAAFGVASTVAAFATSAEMLIVSRAAMGVAGATLMPSTLALISNMFRDPRQRALAIGVWATMFSAGIALGPIVGGLLLQYFWWGSVFLLGVPVMVLLLVAAPILPEFHDPDANGRVDLISVALAVPTMLALALGVKELSTDGIGPLSLGSILTGIVLGTGFVRRQRRLDDPLLDLQLFANPALRGALAILLVSVGTVGGTYLFVTQYLQLVADRSAVTAGLLLMPAAGVLIVTSLLAPLVARRIRPGRVVVAALIASALGFIVLAQARTAADVWLVVVGFVLVYAGVGATTALGTELVVGVAPPEKAGAASALGETSTELGVALGIAGLGSIGAALFTSDRIANQYADAGIGAPPETLAAGVDAAQGLPPGAGHELVAVATSAFMDGFNAAAWVSAVIVLAIAAVAAVTLRGVESHVSPEPD